MPLQLNPSFARVLAGANSPQVGMWLCSGSALVAEICAGGGLDWLLVDMEHSPNGLAGVQAQLQAIAGYPTTPVVRVPSDDAVTIKQVLDLGAQDILVPMVSTAEQAADVASAAYYPPVGRRGVGSALARSGRWNRVPNYLADAQQHVGVFVQVETAQGVENAREIAATPGIDGVFVGPSDLAASMGLLGQQAHPDVVAAVEHTIRAVHEAGKPVGVNAFDPGQARAYLESGVDFILVGADVALLARGSEALAADFGAAGAGTPQKSSY